MTQAHIPIVDIAPFREGDPEGSRYAVERIGRACEEIGFFTIVGHGVSGRFDQPPLLYFARLF